MIYKIETKLENELELLKRCVWFGYKKEGEGVSHIGICVEYNPIFIGFSFIDRTVWVKK